MPATGYQSIATEARDGVAWITLNRPEAINAINDSMRRELPAALRALDEDPAVRVIVLRGAGPRGFCAGADLKEAREAVAPASERSRWVSASWIQGFDQVAKPVLAAIHGYCLGGGLEIALACDLRIASADAVFALPETGLGLIPGGGGTQRLPRLVGLARAFDLLTTGDHIDAAEAWRIGLITRLSSGIEALGIDVAQLARRIAERPPTAIRYAKEAAKGALELSMDAGFRLEQDLFGRLLGSAEHREATAAFREKRAPVFSGK